jgi:hypothetical protein
LKLHLEKLSPETLKLYNTMHQRGGWIDEENWNAMVDELGYARGPAINRRNGLVEGGLVEEKATKSGWRWRVGGGR